MEKPGIRPGRKLYRTGLLGMKKHFLVFFILIAACSCLYAQGNRPMAAIITNQDNQILSAPEEPGQEFITPRLYWEGASRTRVPLQIKAGDRVTLVLRAAGWSASAPPPAFFMPEVPLDVILASAPVSADERYNGIIIKLTLIPLKEGVFILPARTLQHENILFEIPLLTIKTVNRE